MLKSLADYRFSRVLRESAEDGYVYEFTPEKSGEPVILAAWHTTKQSYEMTFDEARRFLRAERMPLRDAPAEAVSVKAGAGKLTLTCGGDPVLLRLQP
jgi:hypothetical protein